MPLHEVRLITSRRHTSSLHRVKPSKQTLVSRQAHGTVYTSSSVAVSFEMLTLTLLPLEEVLPGRTVSGVGTEHFDKSREILS